MLSGLLSRLLSGIALWDCSLGLLSGIALLIAFWIALQIAHQIALWDCSLGLPSGLLSGIVLWIALQIALRIALWDCSHDCSLGLLSGLLSEMLSEFRSLIALALLLLPVWGLVLE